MNKKQKLPAIVFSVAILIWLGAIFFPIWGDPRISWHIINALVVLGAVIWYGTASMNRDDAP